MILREVADDIRDQHFHNIEHKLEEALDLLETTAEEADLKTLTQNGVTTYYINGTPVVEDYGLIKGDYGMKYKMRAYPAVPVHHTTFRYAGK